MDIKRLNIDLSHFGRENVTKVSRIRRTPAACALDLGDGSERGEYVCQDYIINKLGMPHRNVGLMYTYYPLDKEWPMRSSEAYPDKEVHYQWDYPYDDYFTYGGGIDGDKDATVFQEMRDIRRHGQDVTLTLTVDCKVGNEYLIAVAKDLATYGRMRLRINHECAGTWFTHNQRYSYKEIADFFCRFHRIVKEYAPNVDTVFCSGFIDNDGEKMEHEDDFLEAFRTADVWSGDRYLALHPGWPFDICDKGDPSYVAYSSADYISVVEKTLERLKEINGGIRKPFSATEFNTDGDVTGPYGQGEGMLNFAKYLMEHGMEGYSNLAYYQFRDRGRLGLEMEDPNCPGVGIPQPIMDDYKWMMKQDFFKPGIEKLEELTETSQDIAMRWGGAEDAEGVEISLRLDAAPVFFDVEFPKEANLMFSVNGRWFYKSPGVSVIDCMPAFFEKDASSVVPGEEISMTIFAPPADGENPVTDDEDWNVNYRTVLDFLPKFRIRYNPCEIVR